MTTRSRAALPAVPAAAATRESVPGFRRERVVSKSGTVSEIIVISDSPPVKPFSGLKRAESAVKNVQNSGKTVQNSAKSVANSARNGSNTARNVSSSAKTTQDASSTASKRPIGSAGKRKRSDEQDYGARPIKLPAVSSSRPMPPTTPACDDKDGHYVITIDSFLTPRYKIVRMLGQGTFGKVVQCYDRQLRKHVAIKVIRAIDKYRDASIIEIRVLARLREKDPENKFKCVKFIDWFDHCHHVCIVTELLSESVFDFLKSNDYAPFPPAHIQSFARQLLQSVAYMHEQCLIHTDLKPENILLVRNEYRATQYLPRPDSTSRYRKVLESSDIKLIDFGSATFSNEHHSNVVSTRHYRAPEIILGLGWSYPCDAYSLGCIFVEFYTGEALYQTHDNLEHLAMMEAVIGKMPERLVKQAIRAKPEFFTRTGQLDYPNATTSKTSKKYMKKMRRLDEIVYPDPQDIVNSRFYDLLRGLLHFDPVHRLTVQDALRHSFFDLNIPLNV